MFWNALRRWASEDEEPTANCFAAGIRETLDCSRVGATLPQSDATAFLRPATVVRDRGDIRNRVDTDAQRCQRTHGRFATGARTLDPHVQVLDALLLGLKPWPPDEAHDNAPPWRSVIVMIVLLNEACTWAMPSATFLRIFLLTRRAAVLAGALAMLCSLC
jgi:hypothetical protein